MQIIVVSRHLASARTITIMPRHVLAATILFFALVLLSSVALSWLSVHFRIPVVESLLVSIHQREDQENRDYLTNNLQLMATRLGELQGRLLQLDTLKERVSGLVGVKPPSASKKEETPVLPGQGGPFIPAVMDAEALLKEIDRLALEVDRQSEDLAFLEFRLLEKRVQDRLLPTTLPVKNAVIGSGFGYRNDPFAGLRARHEGLDFAAPTGTPVVAAADGVVLDAFYHPEFGNMIDIDHGEGLVSRYAHLSTMRVKPGQVVRRNERIGAVGNTGRSTGPHLHFEVRMLGIAQNPATFLRQGVNTSLARRP